MRIVLFILLIVLFSSCSKEEKTSQQIQKKENTDTENLADTNLTPKEKFSTSILADFLNDSEDGELAEYLEEEIYKMGSSYKGASIIEISPAVWFLMFEKDGGTKNYLLQKFVNFKTNDYYFLLKETSISITDIITKGKVNTPSAETTEQ